MVRAQEPGSLERPVEPLDATGEARRPARGVVIRRAFAATNVAVPAGRASVTACSQAFSRSNRNSPLLAATNGTQAFLPDNRRQTASRPTVAKARETRPSTNEPSGLMVEPTEMALMSKAMGTAEDIITTSELSEG